MKKSLVNRITSIVLILTLMVVMSACGGANASGEADGTKKITLNLAFQDAVESNTGVEMQKWADDVYEKSGGGLEIKIHGSSSLAAGPDVYDAVKSGLADIGWIFTMYTADQFKYAEVITLPMIGVTHPSQAANILWDLYEETPEIQDEMSSIKILEMYGNPANFVATAKKPIKTMDDFKGVSLRSPAGGMMEVFKGWGANPIAVGAADAYDAIQKGNIDGTSWDWQGLVNFKLYELLNYYMDMTTYTGVFLLAINNDKYDSLPPEYQKALQDASGREGSISFGDAFHDNAQKSKELILANGGELVPVAPAEVEKLKAVAEDYMQVYVKKISVDGFDGQAYLDRTLELVEKYRVN